METLDESVLFPSTVYAIKKPEFLEVVSKVSAQYMQAYKPNEPQMTVMTGGFAHEPEVKDFAQYVSQTAWNILKSQGFAMDNLVTYFMEMWTQEHNNHSHMEYHVHGLGAQISAFYFLETPPEGCRLILHDPRPAKVITNLPEKDFSKVSAASTQIVFTPNAGTLFFAPAWLPHSFSKNMDEKPTVFVHMNLGVVAAPQAEVI
jgi:uncharacterized protein (TIGR02466 family)